MSSEQMVVNPYDFIPFGNGPDRKPLDEYKSDEMLSGWFDVQLEIKSPLIIPDVSHVTPEAVEVRKKDRTVTEIHNHYGFFRLPDGTPAIPGSALRGMLRSVYEAATDSCLPFLPKEPDHPISQRTPLFAAFKDRGLLCFDPNTGVWTLYKTKAYYIETTRSAVASGKFQGYRQGQKIRFSVNTNGSVVLGHGDQEGWLQFNVPVDPKNPYHVALLQPRESVHQEKENELGKEDVSMCQSLRTAVFDSKENVKKSRLDSTEPDLLQCLLDVQKNGGAVPCYYFIVERGGKKLVYLSGAAVGRVRQRRNWKDIMGEHGPCSQLDCLCPACALFGTVQGGGTAGRVFISNAEPVEISAPAERTLPILSAPRTSAFEFYLRKPVENATYWNFDYYGVKASYSYEKDGETRTVSYTDYRDLSEATPRGRKMYWHGAPRTDSRKSRQNATMEAIDEGNFRFRIRFDRVTPAQLGDLLWCVTLGNNKENDKYRHKLGHGKPVGYGSVKLTASPVTLRELSPEDGFSVRIRTVDPETYMEASEQGSAIRAEQRDAILRMTDFDAAKDLTVAYPTGWDNRGVETVYAWFAANRVSADDVLTLPEPTDDSLALPSPRGKRPSRENAQRNNSGSSFYGGTRQSGGKSRQGSGAHQDADSGALVYGAVLRGVRVSNTSGRNVFFILPGTRINGHYYARNGEFFARGDLVDVKVLSYSERFQTYDVEVLGR